jgi:hypothetical protein
VIVTCAGCGKKLNVPDTAAGKKGRCPGCRAVFDVPAVAAATKNPAEPGSAAGEPAAAPARSSRRSPPPEPDRRDDGDREGLAEAVPGLRCPNCEAVAVAKLPPNRFSRHPGYVCAKCGTVMRRPGTTGNYYATAALGAFVALLGLALAVLAMDAESYRGRRIAGGVGIFALGALAAGWGIRQSRLPVPGGAKAPPSRIVFWIAVLVIGLLLAGAAVFGFLYYLQEMM